MRLTTLWPNRILIWKDWKNIWVLATLFFGFLTYVSSYTLWNEIMFYKEQLQYAVFGMYETSSLLQFQSASWVLTILFTVGLAALLIGLERDQKTYDVLLAMPFTRAAVFHNKFILGLGILLAVFVFNALVMTLLVAAHPDVSFPFSTADIWGWALRYLVVVSFVFSFTMLISTVSGTALGNGVLGLIFLFFPVGFTGLIAMNLDYWQLYNVRPLSDALLEWGALLTVPVYLSPFNLLDDGGYSLPLVYGLIIAAALGSYLLAQHLFARNQMEYNGEVLMFRKLEGFFKLGVAVCFALLAGPFFTAWAEQNLLAGVISYAVVGVIFWFVVTGIINWRKRAA